MTWLLLYNQTQAISVKHRCKFVALYLFISYMVWHINVTWRSTTAWVGGTLSGVIALLVFVDQVSFDREVRAAVSQLRQETTATQNEILQQLLTQQKIQTQQSSQQFYTLRIEILEAEIERLQDKLLGVAQPERWWIEDRLKRANERLDEMRLKLEALMLHATP